MATTTITATAQAPPFPDDVPTAPLLRIAFEKLLQRDKIELERFVQACEDLGFFYLDLTGPGDALLAEAEQLFGVGEELFDLPLDEKAKYDFSAQKSYFGYKAQGAAVVDRKGNIDRNEFYNVSPQRIPRAALTVQGLQGRHTRLLGPLTSTNRPEPQKTSARIFHPIGTLHRRSRPGIVE
jgi:isopenicillin N synthase-like dioxygenase